MILAQNGKTNKAIVKNFKFDSNLYNVYIVDAHTPTIINTPTIRNRDRYEEERAFSTFFGLLEGVILGVY
jgi:hypothetical protein